MRSPKEEGESAHAEPHRIIIDSLAAARRSCTQCLIDQLGTRTSELGEAIAALAPPTMRPVRLTARTTDRRVHRSS